MPSRIDVAFRVLPGVAYLSVRYPAGAGSWVPVPVAEGCYWTPDQLAAALQDGLHAVSDGDLFCEVIGATHQTFRVYSSGDLFDVRLNSRALRLHLGWLGAEYLDTLSHAGLSPYSWTGRHAALCTGVDLVRSRKVETRPRGDVAVVPLTSCREWALQYMVGATEAAGFRTVMGFALHGQPCQWSPDTSNADPIDLAANPNGVVRGTLVESSYTDDWADEITQRLLTVRFKVREA